MREKLVAFLAIIGLTQIALAQPFPSTVQIYITTVNATPTGGTWQVFAQDSDDNDGLSAWDIDVLGTGGAAVNSLATIEAPRPRDNTDQYALGNGGRMGFNSFVSGGTISGTNLVQITAQQTAIYGETDQPTYDMGVLVGVGQEPSSASPQNGTQGPPDGSGTPTGIPTPVWDYTPLTTVSGGAGAPSYQIAGTLIEQGTYTTTTSQGFLTVEPYTDFINNGNGGEVGMLTTYPEVLGTTDSGMNERWGYAPYQIGNTPEALTLPDTIPLSVPEPTSLGILIFSAGILSVRSHRDQRPHKSPPRPKSTSPFVSA